MINRISDLFEDDEGLPISPMPTSDDLVVLLYAGQSPKGKGMYSVMVHNPNLHQNDVYALVYCGPLGDAIVQSERILEDLKRAGLGDVEDGMVWWEDGIDIIMGDPDYEPNEVLSPGEYYWWVQCNQYGPYPGDEWYSQKMDEEEGQDLTNLNN